MIVLSFAHAFRSHSHRYSGVPSTLECDTSAILTGEYGTLTFRDHFECVDAQATCKGVGRESSPGACACVSGGLRDILII